MPFAKVSWLDGNEDGGLGRHLNHWRCPRKADTSSLAESMALLAPRRIVSLVPSLVEISMSVSEVLLAARSSDAFV